MLFSEKCDLFGVFTISKIFHNAKPIFHGLAVFSFYLREVRSAIVILRRQLSISCGAMTTTLGL
jgi:hypothetical protein